MYFCHPERSAAKSKGYALAFAFAVDVAVTVAPNFALSVQIRVIREIRGEPSPLHSSV
jgi:hypothetical protein